MKRAAVKRWCWLLTGLKLNVHISPKCSFPMALKYYPFVRGNALTAGFLDVRVLVGELAVNP